MMSQQVCRGSKHRDAYEENILDVRQRKGPHVFPEAILGYYKIVSLHCKTRRISNVQRTENTVGGTPRATAIHIA